MIQIGADILSRLKFGTKFRLLLLILILPLLYAAWLLYLDGRRNILAIETKLTGLTLVKALFPIRTLASEHRYVTSQWLNGDVDAKPVAIELESNMVLAMNTLKAKIDETDTKVWAQTPLSKLLERWQSISSTQLKPMSRMVIFPRHSDWIADIDKLADLADNKFGISLHSNSDVYTLTDLGLTSFPKLLEFIGQYWGRGAEITAAKKFESRDYIVLSNLYDTIDEQLSRVLRQIDTLAAQDRALPIELLEKFKLASENLEVFLELSEEEFLNSDEIAISANAYYQKGREVINLVEDIQIEIVENLQLRLEGYRKQELRERLLAFSIFSTLVLFAFYLFICVQYNIRESISKVRQMATDLQKGDISSMYTIKSKDELGEVVNALTDSFIKLRINIGNLKSQSHEQTGSAESLFSLAVESSDLVQVQRSELDRMLVTVNQVIQSSEEVFDLCGTATDEAQLARESANRGVDRALSSVNAIGELSKSIKQASEEINELDEQTTQIGNIIDVIKSIAEQTNLLALNAAIESARAGEQGRGFAVVADEVRTLAKRTQDSTEEIASSIIKLQEVARSSVNSMNGAVALADDGQKGAAETGEVLKEIQDVIVRVTEVIHKVSDAGQVQSSVLNQIGRDVEGVEQAVAKLEDRFGFVSKTAKQLKQHTESMDAIVDNFKI